MKYFKQIETTLSETEFQSSLTSPFVLTIG